MADWLASPWKSPAKSAKKADQQPLDRARHSLQELLSDSSVPAAVRESLKADFEQVQLMSRKLEQGDIHLAVFGRVGVGKSSLANTLLGREQFAVSPLHGETKHARTARWRESEVGGVHLIDTPGIDELDGEAREKLAFEVTERSDLVLFVLDGDMTQSEREALSTLAAQQRPIIMVLNKADRYTAPELQLLLQRLAERSSAFVNAEHIVTASADRGDVVELTETLWQVIEAEGRTLSALNAALFAGRLSDAVGERITEVRKQLAERVIHTYCLGQGVAVALNPIPLADLAAAAAIDASMLVHLGKIYGTPIGKQEAVKLGGTIVAQLAALMTAVWGVHLVSSALKGATAGLSVAVTAGAQGALAYYATWLVGSIASRYFASGKSWGEHGPKRVAEEILDSVDRDSILRTARAEILARLKASRQ